MNEFKVLYFVLKFTALVSMLAAIYFLAQISPYAVYALALLIVFQSTDKAGEAIWRSYMETRHKPSPSATEGKQ